MLENRYIGLWVGLLIGILSACSSRSLHEAQTVVATADSLRAEGRQYDDSMQLAQAYTTLGQWQWLYPDDYTHACYYYGRLLRAQDDPVAAMQCFINATHTRTYDRHILARVYSNMGSVCHMAGEFQLSHDMYERCADLFLTNGDTLNYYYALYHMAFEKAELTDSIRCLSITQKIENIPELYDLTALTKAVLYRQTQQYDSSIYYAEKIWQIPYYKTAAMIVIAQSYEKSGRNDSALVYANMILADTSASYQEKFNALYIVSHFDSTLSAKDISALDSQREDIRYYEYEPEHEKLSRAVQLLEQDLSKGLNWWSIGMIILSVLCATAGLLSFLTRKRAQKKVKAITEKQAESIIKSIKIHIAEKDIYTTLHWKVYESMKTEVDLYTNGIVSKLETYRLNEVEIRFCVLTLLDYKLRTIAKIINYSYPSAIKTLKKRIANKLGTTPPELKDFLLHMLPKS